MKFPIRKCITTQFLPQKVTPPSSITWTKLNLKQKIENISGQINQKYTFFHENIMKVIDKNATLKKLTKEELKRSKNLCITKGILTSIKKKYILLKKVIKSNHQLTFLRYKTYRDKINHLIRKSKKKHYPHKKISEILPLHTGIIVALSNK